MEEGESRLFLFNGWEINPAGLKKSEGKEFAVFTEIDLGGLEKLAEGTPVSEWPTLSRYCSIHYNVVTPIKSEKVSEGELIQIEYTGCIERPTEDNPNGKLHTYNVEVLREEPEEKEKGKKEQKK